MSSEQLIAAYQPYCPPQDWLPVASTVRAAVSAIAVRPSLAQFYMFIVSRFAMWAVNETGLPAEVTVLFRDEVIERYTLTGMRRFEPRTHTVHRAALRRAMRALDQDVPVAALKLPYATSRPYPPQVLAHMWIAAAQQLTVTRVETAQLMIGLAAGAGLRSREISRARCSDVRRSAGLLVVDVPGPTPRTVPICARYADTLERLASTRTGLLLRPAAPRTSTSNLLRHCEFPPSCGRPNNQRLRVSWAVALLDAGAPYHEVQRVAGIVDPGWLRTLAPFLAARPDTWTLMSEAVQ